MLSTQRAEARGWLLCLSVCAAGTGIRDGEKSRGVLQLVCTMVHTSCSAKCLKGDRGKNQRFKGGYGSGFGGEVLGGLATINMHHNKAVASGMKAIYKEGGGFTSRARVALLLLLRCRLLRLLAGTPSPYPLHSSSNKEEQAAAAAQSLQ